MCERGYWGRGPVDGGEYVLGELGDLFEVEGAAPKVEVGRLAVRPAQELGDVGLVLAQGKYAG